MARWRQRLCSHGVTGGVLFLWCARGVVLTQPAPDRDVLAEARKLTADGQYGAARAMLAPLTRSQAAAGHAHILLGIADEQEGRLADAIAHYREAVERLPRDAGALDRLGFALGRSGQTDEALAIFERAVAANPGHFEAQYHLGATRWWVKQPQRAVAPLAEAVRIQPDHAEARYYLGRALRQVGRTAEALTHLERATALRPTLAPAHAQLGVAR